MFLQTHPGCGFFNKLTIDNVNRAKISLLIISFLELALIIRNFINHGLTFRYYIVFYVVLLSISLITLLILWRMPNKEQHIIFLDRVMLAYYVFLNIWGGALSVLDQFSYGQVTAYLANVLVGVLMYHSSMKKFIVIQFVPLLIVAVSLYFAQANFSVFTGHMINIFVFMVFATIGSRFLYNSGAQNYMQQHLLTETNAELEALNEELQYLSVRDELTTLPNRRGLYHYVEQNLHVPGQTVTAVILDIDAFKHYNDYYGHLEGDNVLRTVAKILQKEADHIHAFAARYGGEEFMFILFNRTEHETLTFAENVRTAIFAEKIPHAASPFEPYVSASLGISKPHLCEEVNMTQLFKEADEALYEAKSNGRNQVLRYELV